MKKTLCVLIVLSAMAFPARPAWAEPGNDSWREKTLKRGQGLTQLLVANSCGIDHLFAVMDRNNISIRKLRVLDPKKPVLIPSEEECAAAAGPKEARASKEIILADTMSKAAREEANRKLLQANTHVLELEKRLAEKDHAITALQAKLTQKEQAAVPPSVPPAAAAATTKSTGVPEWLLAVSVAIAFVFGGAGVKTFDRFRTGSATVSYPAEVEVKLRDGTRHAFRFAGAKAQSGGEPEPVYRCPYCDRADLQVRAGEDPHTEFSEHMRAGHYARRVRIVSPA